jgi:4a-hydroxytetrahydrobiopterin dehydratase
MELAKLSDNEIQENLKELDGWIVQNGKLHKEIEFANFDRAWEFMTIAVSEIQKMNHHPEWFNVYNKLVIDLMTHDVGGISQNDINLAKFLDKIPVIPPL